MRNMRLLIVDDSFAVRTRLEALLAALENVEIVGQAASRPEGIAAVRSLNLPATGGTDSTAFFIKE